MGAVRHGRGSCRHAAMQRAPPLVRCREAAPSAAVSSLAPTSASERIEPGRPARTRIATRVPGQVGGIGPTTHPVGRGASVLRGGLVGVLAAVVRAWRVVQRVGWLSSLEPATGAGLASPASAPPGSACWRRVAFGTPVALVVKDSWGRER